MKGDMEVEVLKDNSAQEDLAKARRRMDQMVQSSSDHETACYNPNAGSKAPASYED
jgi:hypothetical protein